MGKLNILAIILIVIIMIIITISVLYFNFKNENSNISEPKKLISGMVLEESWMENSKDAVKSNQTYESELGYNKNYYSFSHHRNDDSEDYEENESSEDENGEDENNNTTSDDNGNNNTTEDENKNDTTDNGNVENNTTTDENKNDTADDEPIKQIPEWINSEEFISPIWMNIYGNTSFEKEDIIGIFDKSGRLCGKFTIKNDEKYGFLHIYGNTYPDIGKDCFSENEIIIIKVFDYSEKEEIILNKSIAWNGFQTIRFDLG